MPRLSKVSFVFLFIKSLSHCGEMYCQAAQFLFIPSQWTEKKRDRESRMGNK